MDHVDEMNQYDWCSDQDFETLFSWSCSLRPDITRSNESEPEALGLGALGPKTVSELEVKEEDQKPREKVAGRQFVLCRLASNPLTDGISDIMKTRVQTQTQSQSQSQFQSNDSTLSNDSKSEDPMSNQFLIAVIMALNFHLIDQIPWLIQQIDQEFVYFFPYDKRFKHLKQVFGILSQHTVKSFEKAYQGLLEEYLSESEDNNLITGWDFLKGKLTEMVQTMEQILLDQVSMINKRITSNEMTGCELSM